MLRNRKRELAFLDNRYARSGAEFVVLYGRRRVGKTTLIYEWCQDKPAVYFFAARLPAQVLLQEFSQQVAQALGQPQRTFPDWTSVLRALANLARDRRFVVVIGYDAQTMREKLPALVPEGCELTLVENPRYEEPNGVSLRAGIDELDEPFALLMSDHLFTHDRLERAIAAEPGFNMPA